MLTKQQVEAYLKRLGIAGAQPPSLDFLIKLHQAHVQYISWQTIDIVAGRPAPIDLASSVRLILNGRSGYCFHLNGAFFALLHTLGYRVSRHRAGVQPLGQEPRINGYHLGLTVTMTNARLETEQWIVDVGLGDMPFAPIPLRPGKYEQGPLTYQVMPSLAAPNGWRLVHAAPTSFVGVDYAPDEVNSLDECLVRHEHYSRSPDSPWIRLFLVRQRHAAGSNELRGCIWSRQDRNGTIKTELATKSRWLEVLGDVFQERLPDYDKLEQDDLWKRVRHLHEEWKKTQEGAAG